MKFCESLYCIPVTYIDTSTILQLKKKCNSIILFFLSESRFIEKETRSIDRILSISEGKSSSRTWEVRAACDSTFSPNTWDTIFGFSELLCDGRGRLSSPQGLWRKAEGRESSLRNHSVLENWDLWGHLKMLPEALAGLYRGVKSSKVRWSQVPILIALLASCKAGAVCFLNLSETQFFSVEWRLYTYPSIVVRIKNEIMLIKC